jgi:hypothetical protein
MYSTPPEIVKCDKCRWKVLWLETVNCFYCQNTRRTAVPLCELIKTNMNNVGEYIYDG